MSDHEIIPYRKRLDKALPKLGWKKYDCPICDEPCFPEKEAVLLDADAHDVLPGNPNMELVQFTCANGHHFYVRKQNIERPYPGAEGEADDCQT